MEFLLTIVQD